MGGGILRATGGQFGDSSSNDGSIDLGNGTLDYNQQPFTNNSILNIGNGTIQIGGNFTNDGTFDKLSKAKADFDGTITTINLDGDFSGSNAFRDVIVRANVEVNPANSLSSTGSGNPVAVEDTLTVESGGQYGESGINDGVLEEKSDLRYEGPEFSVSGDLFSNKVNFAGGGATNVSGSVFAEVQISGSTTVQVGDNTFTVFGKVQVNTEGTLDVANKELILNGDVLVDGDFLATNGTVKFQGNGRTTCCSLDGSAFNDTSNDVQELTGNANVNFGTLIVQDTTNDGNSTPETDVFVPTSASVTSITGDFTVDEANFTTARPLTLQNNFTVESDANFNVDGENLLTFSGGSGQDVSLPEPLSLQLVELDKTSGAVNLKSDLIISDTLRMSRGTLSPEAKLTLEDKLVLGGGMIDVAGGGGSVVLESNDTNQAHIRYTGSGSVATTINGKLTYQRRLDGIQDWYYIAAPEDDGTNTTFTEFLEQGGTNDLWTAGMSNSDNPSLAEPSIRFYDETAAGAADATDPGWTGISDVQNTMDSGKGYAVYVWGDEDMDGSDEGFPKIIDAQVDPFSSTSFEFSTSDGSASDGPGIDANDNTSPSGIDDDEGWNLLANPYFNNVDFCAMTRGSGLSPTVEVWDPQNSSDNTSSNGYATYNCDTQSAGGPGSGLEKGYLSPHQAFFVKAQSTSNLGLSIDNITNQQVDTTGIFQKQRSLSERPPAVALQFSFDEAEYTTSVGFIEDASKGRDASDGLYIDGAKTKSGLSVASLLDDGTALTTNAMPRDLSDETTVPLGVDACNSGKAFKGSVTIRRSTFRNIPAEWGVTLKDTETGETIDLHSRAKYTLDAFSGDCPTSSKALATKQSDGPSVGLPTPQPTSSLSKSGSGNTRFQLVIDPDGALNSIENSMGSGSFTVRTTSDEVVLEDLPSPNAGANVVVQHKPAADDAQFETLTTLSASKSSNSYSVKKNTLESGEHTFRLLATTKSSKRTLAEQTVGIFEEELVVYPNPVGQEQATVNFSTTETKDVTLSLYNTLGQRVKILHKGEVRGSKSITVDTQSLASGVYFVRMRGDGVMTTTRMTIVK
jgi:hypothetical protein